MFLDLEKLYCELRRKLFRERINIASETKLEFRLGDISWRVTS